MFAVFGMLSVCFYEPAIVVYIILTLFIVWNNYKNKKDLLPLAIMAAHIAIIGIYYILIPVPAKSNREAVSLKQIYWSIPHSLPIIRKIYSPILQIQYSKTVTIKVLLSFSVVINL